MEFHKESFFSTGSSVGSLLLILFKAVLSGPIPSILRLSVRERYGFRDKGHMHNIEAVLLQRDAWS